ncbi:LysR substrate-binding domain-containing protein [Thauera sp.]|uniref:LysR family transcriptional regulator n=1 Tax=Thauera sp. TaxID=1905334 RepID=UPI001B71A8FB|nr:LysR substrate-binding domain-containing protein [Thauera sp.]MBP6130543.1 LysR family transcriptional regulator [Thauera sp.]MBP7048523.1 LysR family transcriptional regulator [Thauera sp.]
MKINQLRYFLAVADKGSVRAAATALGVSAAAVSQALRELETAMGTPLFTRESHGAVLSYAGRQFLIHARLILGQVSRAEAEIAQIRGATGGSLTIGVTPWVAQSILPHALARFHALRPDVHLDVTEAVGTVHPLLRDGTLDLVIAIPPPRQEASIFYTRELFRCDLAVVGRLGHPFASATSLEELVDQDWVLTMLGAGQDEPLVNLLAPHGIAPPPHRVHYARSALVAISMLEVGNMLTICPWPLLETPLLRGRVQALPIRNPLPEMHTAIIVRRNDTLSAAGQLFIDCFEDTTRTCVATDDPALKRIMNSVERTPDA